MSGARLVSSHPVELGGSFYVVKRYFDERDGWHRKIMLVVEGQERPVESEAVRNAVLARAVLDAQDRHHKGSSSGLATRLSTNGLLREEPVIPPTLTELAEATEARKSPRTVEEVLAVLEQGEAEGWACRTSEGWATEKSQKELISMMPRGGRWTLPKDLFAHLRKRHGFIVRTSRASEHGRD